MKIAIDATRAVVEGAGLGRYTFELVSNLIKIDKENEYILIFTHYKTDETKAAKVEELTQSGKIASAHIPIPNKVKERLWRLGVPYYRGALKGCDLLFSPTPFELNFGLKIPQVITIHDLIPSLFPEQLGKKRSLLLDRWGKRAADKARMIIADSFATKKDIENIYEIDSKKLKVVYLGPKKFEKLSNELPMELKKGAYILAAGTVEPRKNLVGLFKAYAMLDEVTRNKYPLVLAGTKGSKSSDIINAIQNLNLENDVKFLGYVTDEELGRVYSDCLFFAFPSLYEGFGLPVLEALSFGKAVLTSNVSSLPEVAGEAGLKVNPRDIVAIHKGLFKLINDDKLRSSLESQAKLQADKFSWEKAARETIEVFKGAVK